MIQGLANKIIQSVNETTTTANIAYLPSGFVPVRKALATLAKKKKKWNIQILDDLVNESYIVKLEDALSISVKKKDWVSFQENIKGRIVSGDTYMIDLGGFLNEQNENDLRALFKELEGELYGMLVVPPVSTIDNDISTWLRKFKVTSYQTSDNTLLKYETLEKDMKLLIKSIESSYGDDRGSLEMLISSLEQKRPLGTFDNFDNHEYLIGSSMRSSYGKIVLTFECYVNMSWIISERVIINDDEIADQMEGYPTVKIVNGVMYPKDKTFKASILKALKDEIDLKA